MSNKIKRTNLPAASLIRAHWLEHGIQRGVVSRVYENIEAKDACFCCGRTHRKLERAHIIPHALGGSGDVDNLLLLCAECHKEAPDVAVEHVVIDWMNDQLCPDGKRIGVLQAAMQDVPECVVEQAMQLSNERIRTIADGVARQVGLHGGAFSDGSLSWMVNQVLALAALEASAPREK